MIYCVTIVSHETYIIEQATLDDVMDILSYFNRMNINIEFIRIDLIDKELTI